MTLTMRAAALACCAVRLACCAVIGAGLSVPVAAATGRATAPVIANRPRLVVTAPASVHATWSASNWSGYAESGTYTGVTSTWTVPAVAATASATYASTWIGVDGFSNSDLIQTGTEQDYYSGSAHYDAWWEILPAAETEISTTTHPVAPGDRMKASIWETSATTAVTSGTSKVTEHLWDISLSDTTRAWSFTTSQAYDGPGTSAEWIQEAPEVGNSIATLAHFTTAPSAGTGDFDNAGILTSVAAGGTPTFAGAGLSYTADAGVMIQKSVQVSTPGRPDAALSAFNVAYGATVPQSPAG